MATNRIIVTVPRIIKHKGHFVFGFLYDETGFDIVFWCWTISFAYKNNTRNGG